MRTLLSVLSVFAIVGAGCSSSLDERLSAMLPTAPQLADGLSHRLETGPFDLASRTLTDEQAERTLLRSKRPAKVGVRSYDADAESAVALLGRLGIDALLYEHDGERDAELFWHEYPPEKIHTWALDFAHGKESVETNVRPLDWNPEAKSVRDATLVCLAHVGANPQERCFGFFFWARFCRWTLEVQVSTEGVETGRVQPVIATAAW